MTAKATASAMRTRMESATSLKSPGAPMLRPAITMHLPQTIMAHVLMRSRDMIVREIASLTPIRMAFAMHLKLPGARMKTLAILMQRQQMTMDRALQPNRAMIATATA